MRNVGLVFIAWLFAIPMNVVAAPTLQYAGAACGSGGTQLVMQFSATNLDQSTIANKNNFSVNGRTVVSASATTIENQVLLTLNNGLNQYQDYTVSYSNILDSTSGSASGNTTVFYTAKETGLFAQYYRQNTDLSGSVNFNRVDSHIAEYWRFGDPFSGDSTTKWSIRWRGFVKPSVTGSYYEFLSNHDDGVKLWVNGQLDINDWNDGDDRYVRGIGWFDFIAGHYYPIKYEYYNKESCGWWVCSQTDSDYYLYWRKFVNSSTEWRIIDGNGKTIDGTNLRGNQYKDQYSATNLTTCIDGGVPVSLNQFDITAPSTASTCAPAKITITAKDAANNVFAGYAGTISLSTTSGNGNWSIVRGYGTLNNGASDDGAATYTFSSSDNGQIELALDNSHADTLQIMVADGGVSRQTGNITFAQNTLEITSNDAAGSDVIASREHAFTLRYLEDDGDPNTVCTTPDFNGTANIRMYRNNSGAVAGNGQNPKINTITIGNSLATAAQVPVAFTAGVGSLTLSTTDVGQYSLAVLDDTKTFATSDIVGESSSFTVRPFGFWVDVSGNPAAENEAGAAFKKAGVAFTATIKAVGWQNEADGSYQPSGHGDSDPSNNANLANNPVLPSFGSAGASVSLAHALIAPSGGQTGVLSGTTTIPASSFSNGIATVSDLSWSEVGILELSAQTNANFLSSGKQVIGKSGYVGRFYPDHFAIAAVVTPSLQNGNGSCGFTYQGQSFGFDADPEFTITAQNANNETTQNYAGAFWKLPNLTVDYAAPGAPAAGTTTSLAADISGQLITPSINNGVNQWRASGAEFSFTQSVLPGAGDAPFNTALTVSLNHGAAAIQDSDGACYAPAGSCSNYVLNTDDSVAIRYGRLILDNAQAPVTDALEMPYRAEYWTGSAFATNTLDSGACGSGSSTGTPALAVVDPTRSLTVSDTSVTVGALVDGEAVMTFAAPGAGKEGQLTVTAQGPAWLQSDYDGNGAREQAKAIATFGVQKGNGPILHLREVYR